MENKKNLYKTVDTLEKVEKLSRQIDSHIKKRGETVFSRFPLLFSLLGTLGLVSVFYGFEGVLDKITFFKDHPFLLLAFGIVVLLVTGGLYKRL